MVHVVVEVNRGSERFTVKVQAGSIEQAVRLAAAHYPDGGVRVLFPIEPEAFFIDRSAPALGTGLPRAPSWGPRRP